MTLRLDILGPLECWADETRIAVNGLICQRVLVCLLLEAGQVIPVSRLVEAVWGDDPPATATQQVRKAVARLRRLLPGGAALITTDGPGYRAVLGSAELDLDRFCRSLGAARQATADGMIDEAVRNLEAVRALWRAPVLSGAGGGIIDAASTALDGRRLAAAEQLFALRLARGDSDELVDCLRGLVAAYPLREVLRGQLLRALFASGRRAEALEEYAAVRRLLAEALGIEPGEPLARLHAAMLRDDPALIVARPGTSTVPVPLGRSNLPDDRTDFIGRAKELSDLLQYAEEPGGQGLRIVAIDGMAGSGKTLLAVRAAHRLAARFGDAPLYLDLHGCTPGAEPLPADMVADALLRMLGVPGEHIPDQPEGRIAQWRSVAAERSLLLVLDNARDAGQLLPVLPATSTSLVLITSRARLIHLDGAHSISLGVLPPSDAIALVTATLGAERTGAEPGPTAALAELCGHLPLALEIAAARLRDRPTWTIACLVDRLRDPTRRLDELRFDERSVRRTLLPSYEGLDVEDRTALRLLARHPGVAIDLHAAAALLDTGLGEAENVLERLLAAHLIEQDRIGYYRFHELVHAFALELGNEHAEHAAALRRVLDYYRAATGVACDLLQPGRLVMDSEPPSRSVAVPPFGDLDRAREWLAGERRAVLNAIDLAYRAGLYQHAADLVRNTSFHLDRCGQFEQSSQVVGIGVRASRLLDDPHRLWASLSYQAIADWRLGHLDAAISAATESLEIAVGLADRRGEAKGIGLLGLLYATCGRFDEAVPLLRRSIALKNELGATRAEIESLTCLSWLYGQWGRYGEAADLAEQAVSMSRELGVPENEIAAVVAHAVAALGAGDLELAGRCIRRAREISHADSSPGDLAMIAALSGTVRFRLGDRERIATSIDKALRLGRCTSTPLRQIEVENTVGRLCCAQGWLAAAAVKLHGNALDRASSVGYRVEEARALQGLANAHHALGDASSGAAFRGRADELYDELGIPGGARLRS